MKLSVLFLAVIVVVACSTTGGTTATASPQKEQLLTQAGFVVKTATTPKQQQQLAALPGNHVSAVKYKGKLYYAYPAGSGNQVMSAGRNSTTLTSNCCRPSGRRWLKRVLSQPPNPRLQKKQPGQTTL